MCIENSGTMHIPRWTLTPHVSGHIILASGTVTPMSHNGRRNCGGGVRQSRPPWCLMPVRRHKPEVSFAPW